jgi:hypothetical protein
MLKFNGCIENVGSTVAKLVSVRGKKGIPFHINQITCIFGNSYFSCSNLYYFELFNYKIDLV